MANHLVNSKFTELILPKDQAHHVKNVLRLNEGAYLEIISKNTGNRYSAIIQSCKNDVLIRINKQLDSKKTLSKVKTLLFALCKGQTNEWVIEKSVELAVEQIIIWQAEHSVVKIRSIEDQLKKIKRWEKVAESASKQSGNPNITKINFAQDLKAAVDLTDIKENTNITKICCSLSSDTIDLREIDSATKEFCLIIGPEGDFSQKEEEFIKNNGFIFTTLGPYTLRAETAAIAAISGINAIFAYKT